MKVGLWCLRIGRGIRYNHHLFVCRWLAGNKKYHEELVEVQRADEEGIWNVGYGKIGLFPRHGISNIEARYGVKSKKVCQRNNQEIHNGKLESCILTCQTKSETREMGEKDKVNTTLFKQIVGSLRYVCNNRPDIGFLVGLVSKYTDKSKVSHMKAARSWDT